MLEQAGVLNRSRMKEDDALARRRAATERRGAALRIHQASGLPRWHPAIGNSGKPRTGQDIGIGGEKWLPARSSSNDTVVTSHTGGIEILAYRATEPARRAGSK
ncbi:hypothetical protein ACTMU2_36725 [Cupriavidus basilensis]